LADGFPLSFDGHVQPVVVLLHLLHLLLQYVNVVVVERLLRQLVFKLEVLVLYLQENALVGLDDGLQPVDFFQKSG
jgi:hypothetical protein